MGKAGKRTLGFSLAIEFTLCSPFLYSRPKPHHSVSPLGVEGILNSLPVVYLTFSYKLRINLELSLPSAVTVSS